MFGFGKKKESPSKTRSKVSDESRAETRAQLNLFGVGDDQGQEDIGDDDLEDELLALLGEGGGKPRPKKPKPPTRPPLPGRQPQAAVIDESSYDVGSGDDDDDDIDESELEAELGELTGQTVSSQTASEAVISPPMSSNVNDGSMINTLQDRLTMYQKAKAKSEACGDSAKSRRFARGIKTLEDLVKKAKNGKVIDEAEIPPIVATGETKPKEVEDNGNVPEVPQPLIEDPVPIPTFEPILQIPTTTVPVRSSPEPPSLDSQPAPTSTDSSLVQPPITIDSLVEARLKDYKKMAVVLKRSGDAQGGLQYLKLAKALEAANKSGDPVDLSVFPPVPDSSQSKSEESNQNKQEVSGPPSSETQPEEHPVPTAENVGLPNELFSGPEAPKTIMEALQQRLDKYKSEVEKATSDNNSSKARRMGRIVKQYEDAIKTYKQGKPVQYDELPTPPAFGPIPVPGSSGGTVAAAMGGGGGATDVSNANTELTLPVPTVGGTSPKVPRTSDPTPVGDTSPAKVPKGPSGITPPGSSIIRGGKPVLKLTLQEKQLNEILRRQKLFKDAALQAKRMGDVNQAREFLRTAKKFDQVIEASKSGLPVDMNTLPSAPAEVAALEAEDFELVSGEDCIEVSGDISEVFSKLEEDLKNQLKVCMRTREHYKSIGDVASANRFEKMALESKRDLDTLRLAAKQGGSIPKYHYETRVFNITECNTDLTEDEIEINILQGINYKVANPADVDTFVKVEFPYPSAEEAQVNKTSVIKDTNNPVYNATMKMTINRSARNFQRFIHNKGIKFEVWSKGGFLRSSTLIGVANAKLLGLETKCNVHDAFEILDGRKQVGKLEVKIKLRDPVLMKQITQKKEKWLSIDKL